MKGPVSQSGFVATRAYRQVEELMRDPKLNSIVISGPSGIGKSTLAIEICAKLCNETSTPKIYGLFDCSSLKSFCDDLGLFYQEISHSEDMSLRPASWDMLQDLYTVVNDKFPLYEKFFIFVDVEDVDAMLPVLNHICRKLKKAEEQSRLWKCFMTSEKNIVLPRIFDHMKPKSFITMEGFNLEETKELFKHGDPKMVELAADIRKEVGESPLALGIFMNSWASNEFENSGLEFLNNYSRDVENETRELDRAGHASRETSMLIAIKLSIGRLLNKLPYADKLKEVLKMLSLLNQRNIPKELLLACAETCAEMVPVTPVQARIMIKKLTSTLINRTMCSRKTESDVGLYSLHHLVKESLKLFVEPSDLIPLIRKTLIALTRVMPKDGRRHQTCLVAFYADHGESMDEQIRKQEPTINHADTPFILYLHCHLLVGMAYCLLAQRNGLKGGIEKLKQAKNKYCQLIYGRGYDYERLKRDSSFTEEEVDKQLAIELYEAGQDLSMMSDPKYLQYIRELPLYHRLTTKDVANMSGVNGDELVNGHLVEQRFRQLKEQGRYDGARVIEADGWKGVAIAALLAQIYSVWSKAHGKRAGDISREEECIHQAEAAIAVYERIFSDSKPRVYLLSALITERELLILKLGTTDSSDEVERISQQFKELSIVDKKTDKRLAYEAGLMRSDLSEDHYHRLLCKEAEIKCQGRLYEFRRDDQYYTRGNDLLTEVKDLARLQVHCHSALSFSYKNFASFLYHCERFKDAVIYIIKAMQELHEHVKEDQRSSDAINSSSNGSGDGSHPELDHPRFKALYSDLKSYFEKYAVIMKGRNDKLLDGTTAEAEYLRGVVLILLRMGGGTQPSDANSMFAALENIFENEIRRETVVAEQAQFL